MKAKLLITSVIGLIICLGNAWAQEDYNNAQKAPQKNEVVLTKSITTQKGYNNLQSAYKSALREAREAFPNKDVGIRNLRKGEVKVNSDGSVSNYYSYSIVALPSIIEQRLASALKKSTQGIDEGSCFALDKFTILDEQTDKEKTKSLVVDALKKKGYKVVAKEYLEKLYKEQKGQDSGIYNKKTTAERNNFTAAGYFVSVRITEDYVQVQVVNVSTGEYEVNITETL